MKFHINLASRSLFAITACVLSFSQTVKAGPLSSAGSLHVPAFSHRHVGSSALPPCFVNTPFVSPSRSTTSIYSKTVFTPSVPMSPCLTSQKQLLANAYPAPIHVCSTCLFSTPDDNESAPTPETKSSDVKESSIAKDAQNIVALVGAQGLLIPMSILLANILGLPNRGLGSSFLLGSTAFVEGVQWTIPLFTLAGIMKLIEPYSPALQDVTRATQRSVLAVLGSQRRPLFAVLVSLLLGAVAGWGEEWLFRGVFQTKMSLMFGNEIALAVSGLVFGLLHAVTPVYALLAGAASVFFGYLYNTSDNLAVPMVCHAVYDVGALLWAHYSVTALSKEEQQKILDGGPGAPILSTANNDRV